MPEEFYLGEVGLQQGVVRVHGVVGAVVVAADPTWAPTVWVKGTTHQQFGSTQQQFVLKGPQPIYKNSSPGPVL